MSGVPSQLPPMHAVNHQIPLIDDTKWHCYFNATTMLSQHGHYATIVQVDNIPVHTLATSEVFCMDQPLSEDPDLLELPTLGVWVSVLKRQLLCRHGLHIIGQGVTVLVIITHLIQSHPTLM